MLAGHANADRAKTVFIVEKEMTDHEIICSEMREERIAICMADGIPEKRAELTAWLQVQQFKKQQKKKK